MLLMASGENKLNLLKKIHIPSYRFKKYIKADQYEEVKAKIIQHLIIISIKTYY
jgi:hypothetical protein